MSTERLAEYNKRIEQILANFIDCFGNLNDLRKDLEKEIEQEKQKRVFSLETSTRRGKLERN